MTIINPKDVYIIFLPKEDLTVRENLKILLDYIV